MKKIILLLVGLAILSACGTSQNKTASANKTQPVEITVPTFPGVNEACTINGHDCWEVVQLLPQTQEFQEPNPEDNIWVPTLYRYENPALEAWGIKVHSYVMYRDGGSTQYTLDDVGVLTNRRLGDNPQYGQVTLKFKDGRQYRYSAEGKRIAM